jgi:hypothetical protein
MAGQRRRARRSDDTGQYAIATYGAGWDRDRDPGPVRMHRSQHGVPGRGGAGAGVIHADDACILRPVAGAASWPAYHETISRAGAPAANGIGQTATLRCYWVLSSVR